MGSGLGGVWGSKWEDVLVLLLAAVVRESGEWEGGGVAMVGGWVSHSVLRAGGAGIMEEGNQSIRVMGVEFHRSIVCSNHQDYVGYGGVLIDENE